MHVINHDDFVSNIFHSCQYLHRTAGDTERRYHLRYYKTSPCVHETDQKGYCVKNGPHCAFAHGDNDLRQPVYDDSDMCTDFNDRSSTSNEAGIASTQLEKDRAANEDAKWNGKYLLMHCNYVGIVNKNNFIL